MLTHRKLLLVFCTILVTGSLSVSVGYALYLRSSAYKRTIEQNVSGYLQLATTIDQVIPLTRTSRRFHGVRVLLPDNRTEVFRCAQAVWRQSTGDGGTGNVLEIETGFIHLPAAHNTGDYLALRQSLTHDYRKLDLSAVHLKGIDVIWRQADVGLRVGAAAGVIRLTGDGTGHARLTTNRLNQHQCADPVHIEAVFDTDRALRVRKLVVRAPRIPLAALALDDMLGTAVTDGWFEGTVTADRMPQGERLRIRGSVGDARLEQFTGRLATGPLHGRMDVVVDDATIADRRLAHLSFSGTLAQVHLRDVAPLFGEPDLDGVVDIKVHQARYDDGHVAHLSAEAEARGVSLAALTRLLGYGVITGQLRVTVDSLVVVDDRIRWADLRVDAVAPPDGDATIDRRVILQAAKTLLHVDLGRAAKLLPQKVKYARLGCRLVVDGDELRVMGTHGKDNRTLLTVRVLGRDIPLVKAPTRTYRIRDVVGDLRGVLGQYDLDTLLKWLQDQRGDRDKPD